MKKALVFLLTIILSLSFVITSCKSNDNDDNDATSASSIEESTTDEAISSSEEETTSSIEETTSEESSNDDNESSSFIEETTSEEETSSEEEDLQGYFSANVKYNAYISASPYTAEAIVPDKLNGIYYSADAPGGEPKNDGTGKIWLKLTPTQKYIVSKVKIEGKYSSVENIGNDIYCIHDVCSDLSVTISVKPLPTSESEMLENFGYGILDDGAVSISWNELADVPLRFIELKYNDGKQSYTEYIDASSGKFNELTLKKDTLYSFTVQAVGYEHAGKKVEFDLCYMNSPKNVSFPRVEITTENYIWPTFDVAHSPDKYWGSGITNALYEQCIMTIYDSSNNVVFDSSSNMNDGEEYLGAKMKVRGNTSASHAGNKKYPYKIKLGSKADLLEPLIGRPDDGKVYEDKDWLLLNYGEDGYRIGGEAIADAVGTEWSPDYCYVALYVNGDYRGLYVLSESVKEGNGTEETQSRVPVDDDGYVFECDAYWWNEDLYFNTPMTKDTAMFFTFKYPDSDIIDETSPEYIYIQDYMTRFEEALMADDDSYLDYIDLDSFVKWLLVSDYLCISDGGGANIYLYKKNSTDDTKVFMGPNWDFDSWMGNAEDFCTIRMYWKNCPFYIPYLLRKDSFQQRYTELFNETYDKLDSYIDNAFSQTDNAAHLQLLEYDNARFGTRIKSLSEVKDEFKTWLDEHISWMDSQLNQN
ncbi:MAG: CotH kinase family protein [Clostridia bacterium]|nr:CotH kinase family protein [Clostridia bacterium]